MQRFNALRSRLQSCLLSFGMNALMMSSLTLDSFPSKRYRQMTRMLCSFSLKQPVVHRNRTSFQGCSNARHCWTMLVLLKQSKQHTKRIGTAAFNSLRHRHLMVPKPSCVRHSSTKVFHSLHTVVLNRTNPRHHSSSGDLGNGSSLLQCPKTRTTLNPFLLEPSQHLSRASMDVSQN